MNFQLDGRLLQDSLEVADWPLCHVILKNEAHYPWFLLVPKRTGLTELMQLAPADQVQWMSELTQLSTFVKAYFQPDKLNVAAIGNYVAQLHIHVVGRNKMDPLWPQSIWQSQYVACPIAENEFAQLGKTCRFELKDMFYCVG